MRLFPNARRVKFQLLTEFQGKRILDVGCGNAKTPSAIGIERRHRSDKPSDLQSDIDYDPTLFPWPIQDDAVDLVICSHVLEHLPDTVKTLEEISRITRSGGKVFIEVPHYTWFESFRHYEHIHQFSVQSFDYFTKGNPYYKTDFRLADRRIFFDDLAYCMGGWLANLFPARMRSASASCSRRLRSASSSKSTSRASSRRMKSVAAPFTGAP